MHNNKLDLTELTGLSELFKLFHSGCHLNRLGNASLWHELEQHAQQYQYLFSQLGFELRIDNRGFAWFHEQERRPTISEQSRQLALLLMTLFDYQADNGRSLGQFNQWVIDKALLTNVYEKHQPLFDAEHLSVEGLAKVLSKAENKGFAVKEHHHWYLLPAVYRYLDHFSALCEESIDNDDTQLMAENQSC